MTDNEKKHMYIQSIIWPRDKFKKKVHGQMTDKHIEEIDKRKYTRSKVKINHGNYEENKNTGKTLKMYGGNNGLIAESFIDCPKAKKDIDEGRLKYMSADMANSQKEFNSFIMLYGHSLTDEPVFPQCKILKKIRKNFFSKFFLIPLMLSKIIISKKNNLKKNHLFF